MKIVQIIPELNEGGVELNREFVKEGIEIFVISADGKLNKFKNNYLLL